MNSILGKTISVKYFDSVDYLTLNKYYHNGYREMSFEDIVLSVMYFFKVPREKFLFFRDKRGIQINADLVIFLVCQNCCYCSFLFELCTTDQIQARSVKRSYSAIGAVVYTTKDSLMEHIRINGGAGVLNQFNREKIVPDNNRNCITRILGRYLIQNFGEQPSKEEKFAVAKAAVEIFTCFKATSVYGGAEIFYDPDENTGYLVNQIKYLNSMLKKRSRTSTNTEAAPIASSELYDPTDDLHKLKCSVLPIQIDNVKMLLKKTINARKTLCGGNTRLIEAFPYFFVDTKLIIYDFGLQYGDSTVLKQKWPSLQNTIFTVLNETGNSLDGLRDWNTATTALIGLLKLLPNSHGRLISKIEKFLVFKTIPRTEYLTNNKQPYIIAVGSSKRLIDQYFLVIDRKLLYLPRDYDIIDAFNMLFCTISVFSMKYDSDLKILFTFFEYYVYNLNTKPKLTPRLRQICNRLETLQTLHDLEI